MIDSWDVMSLGSLCFRKVVNTVWKCIWAAALEDALVDLFFDKGNF